MIQETKRKAPSYCLDDLVKIKWVGIPQEEMGLEKGGVYRVVEAGRTKIRVMTTKGKFVPVSNEQVERWGE